MLRNDDLVDNLLLNINVDTYNVKREIPTFLSKKLPNLAKLALRTLASANRTAASANHAAALAVQRASGVAAFGFSSILRPQLCCLWGNFEHFVRHTL